MKPYRYFLPLILFLLFLTPGLGQEIFVSLNEGIVGHWQTDVSGLKSKIEQRQKVAYDTLPVQAKEEMDRAIASRSFVFYKDGVFTAKWKIGGHGNSVEGRWKAAKNGKLTIDVEDSKSEYMVYSNGTDGIVLAPLRKRRGLVHELYFIRKKEK